MITFPEIHNLGTYNLVYIFGRVVNMMAWLTAVLVFNLDLKLLPQHIAFILQQTFSSGLCFRFCAALLNLFMTDII